VWQTRFHANGKVALGESLSPDGVPNPFPRDWILVDWKSADRQINLAERPVLSFRDLSQKIIYSAHLIEHLPQPALTALLRECYRVLDHGGRIRIECPDAEKMVELYRKSDLHLLNHFLNFRRREIVDGRGFDAKYLEVHLSLLGEISNYIIPGENFHMPVYAPKSEFDEKFANLDLEQFAEWCTSLQTPEQRRSGGHQNIIYFSKLKRMLEEAGFADVIRAGFDVTTIPELRLNEGHPQSVQTKPHRRFYSLYVEATMPAKASKPSISRPARAQATANSVS
jgi:hypothetical protein